MLRVKGCSELPLSSRQCSWFSCVTICWVFELVIQLYILDFILLPCGGEFLRQLCPAGSKKVSLETLPVARKQEKLERASGMEGSCKSPMLYRHSLPSNWAQLLVVRLFIS